MLQFGGICSVKIVFLLTFVSLSAQQQEVNVEEPVILSASEAKIYQRQFRIILEAGQYENCFASEVDEGQIFHIEYSVLNSDPNNAQPYFVNLQIRDEKTKSILYNFISSEQYSWNGHRVTNSDPLEICFINIVSRDDYKMIAWTLTIEGKEDERFPLSQQIDLAEKEMTSEEMRRSSSKIVVNLINGQRKLWSIRGSQIQTFMRMEALAQMIDTWSLIHACVVVGISLSQVFVLKKMFSDPPVGSTKLKVRT